MGLSMSSQDLSKVKDEVKTNLDRFHEDYRAFSRELKTASSEYLKNIDTIKKSFDSSLGTITNDLQNLVGPLEQRKNQVFKSDADALRAKLAELVQKTNSQIQAEGKNFQNSIETLIKSSIEIVKQNINNVSTNVEDVYDSEEKAIDDTKTSLMGSVDKAKELYDNAVKQKIESVRSATEAMMDQVALNLKNFKSEASSITKGGQDEIDALMREIIIEVESSYERSSASLRDIMGTIENRINDTFKSKQDDFQEISESLKEKIQTQVQDSQDSSSESQKKIHDALLSFRDTEVFAFDELISSVRDDFIESVELADVKVETEYKNTVDYFKNKLYTEMESATKNADLFYEQSISLFDTVISQLSKSKESLEQSREKLVNGSVKNLSTVAEQMEQSLHSMVDFLFDSFDKEKEKIQTELDSKLNNYNSNYSKNLDKLVTNVMQSFETNNKQHNDVLTKNKTDIDAFAKEHTDKAITTFSNLTTEIRGLMDDFIEDQKRLTETSSVDIQRKLESNQSEIISKLEGIPPQVVSISDTFEENRKVQYSKASSEMDNAIDLFEKEINNWAGDLNSIIAQETSSVERQIDSKRADSKTTFTNAVKELTSNQTQINQKFVENIKTTISTISEQLANIEPSVSEKIDNLIKQFDEQITRFIEKSKEQSTTLKNEYTEFQAQSGAYKTSSSEAYDKLDRNIKPQFENISKSTENLLKALGDTVNTKRPS